MRKEGGRGWREGGGSEGEGEGEGEEGGDEEGKGRGRGWKIKTHTQPRVSSDMHTIYPPIFSIFI